MCIREIYTSKIIVFIYDEIHNDNSYYNTNIKKFKHNYLQSSLSEKLKNYIDLIKFRMFVSL